MRKEKVAPAPTTPAEFTDRELLESILAGIQSLERRISVLEFAQEKSLEGIRFLYSQCIDTDLIEDSQNVLPEAE